MTTVAEKPRRKRTTVRERLVLQVKRDHGLSWSEIAAETGFESIGGMTNTLSSRSPHDSTLVVWRDWLARRGKVVDLADLAKVAG